jgi:hypothetical protein
MGRIWPMASAFQVWRPAERGAPAHLLPRPPAEAARPAPSGQRPSGVAWPACALAGVARTGCAVIAHVAHVVAWLAGAHRWMIIDKVFS